ncbi:nitrogen regulatory protein P-II [Thermocrinis albus DSM 14484]|uniref:Nitrogen regulatory protein P-II n=1 Tax=Thermocrinis albus (strain DSM 14484 / JCM 11386 / HI 11/12) TaxID=638303 RepID=D3SPF8_THEAH|nr:P-II family nitrogen regulator [Thermocrinis albus]ADC89045.1 nitrogen regulatory protein P-II [Thermocrinis albus DSM 14484]
MKLVRAFIRPEKEQEVVLALEGAGFPALTKMSVLGRGKQKGLKIGDVTYEELPKTLLLIVVKDEEVEKVVNTIMNHARTGNIGDGKIFVSPVEKAITIRTGEVEV